MKRIDLTGKVFGKLTVVDLDDWPIWLCQCECGKTKKVNGRYLRDGGTSSCGCNYDITRKGKSLHRPSYDADGRPTFDYVNNLLRYDGASGHFYWKSRPGLSVAASAYLLSRRTAGSLTVGRYTYIRLDRRTYTAHRLAWLLTHGRWPHVGMVIDHIDGDRSNNAIANLREVTPTENAQNRQASGVRYVKRKAVWEARIGVARRSIYVGQSKSKFDAMRMRREAELKYFTTPRAVVLDTFNRRWRDAD